MQKTICIHKDYGSGTILSANRTGDIYGFIFRDKPCLECGGPGKQLDSCWGFYGSDPLENGMSDNLKKEFKDGLQRIAGCA